MSFKEIKELRQAGKLEEALQMAQQNLEAQPENTWNKRAIAWVYYDYLKKNALPENFSIFKENLIKIKDLNLPEEEKMIFDTTAWPIRSLFSELLKQEHLDFVKINDVFTLIQGFYFTKPSKEYTLIYSSFHKFHQTWSRYLEFADWWGFENFRSEDYLKEEFNGKKIMSIAEQAFIAYAKKLLEGELIDPRSQERIIDKDKIQEFLPKLETIIEKYPDYQYPPYFKAKLLLSLGDDENGLSSFLPFAKQKKNDFWVWELMAEFFKSDNDIQFACYCKALSLKTQEDFLVKIRQIFAGLLIEKGMFDEAKTEIDKVVETRTKKENKIPGQIISWTNQNWYKSATAKNNNKDLYAQYSYQAEEILFNDIPEEIIVVDFVNKDKQMLNFIENKDKFGFFKYTGYLDKPKTGDILKVRLQNDGKSEFYKVLTIKKADDIVSSEALKTITGIVRKKEEQNFGFIDDVFIDQVLIDKNKVLNGQKREVKAILSFNKKKNDWGWKAYWVGNEVDAE